MGLEGVKGFNELLVVLDEDFDLLGLLFDERLALEILFDDDAELLNHQDVGHMELACGRGKAFETSFWDALIALAVSLAGQALVARHGWRIYHNVYSLSIATPPLTYTMKMEIEIIPPVRPRAKTGSERRPSRYYLNSLAGSN